LKAEATGNRTLLVCKPGPARDLELLALGGEDLQMEAADGTGAAFKALSSFRPDVALVDGETVWAEEQGGRGLIEALKARHVPIALLISDKVPAELLESAYGAGVDDAILLPLKPNQVRERLQAIFASPPVAKARPSRLRVRLDKASPWAVDLCEQLELNGYDLKLIEGEAQDGDPAELTVLVWDDPARLAKAVGLASGGPQLIVSAHSSPMSAPAGVIGWMARGDSAANQVVRAVNAHFKLPTRDLRADHRIPFFCPVQFREWGIAQNSEWSTGYSYALSPGGLFIRTLVPTRRKVAVEMKIHLTTTGEEFVATGVAAWSNPLVDPKAARRAVGMGVEFLGMPLSKRLLNLIQVCREVGGAVRG
jgi:CheY-like chemotaxis protein/Tfp pilus assembly protein PilZ